MWIFLICLDLTQYSDVTQFSFLANTISIGPVGVNKKECFRYMNTLNRKLVEAGQVGIKGGSSLVNHLVD